VLRRLRTERALSMRQLARLADLSQPFLSNIENGRSMPSIATLYRLADALGVSAQELLPGPADLDVRVATAASLATAAVLPSSDHPDSGLSTLVVGGPSQLIEARRVTVPAGTFDGTWFEHPGEEFVHVLEGTVTVEFRDGRHHTLHRGDSLWYYSVVAHRWSTPDAGDAQVLLINGRVPTHYHAGASREVDG
jgi:quercetin dioxygenase-like cupin family protein/DNA-binding XRE family transcriptional regulator